jgi:hypothetical protein
MHLDGLPQGAAQCRTYASFDRGRDGFQALD